MFLILYWPIHLHKPAIAPSDLHFKSASVCWNCSNEGKRIKPSDYQSLVFLSESRHHVQLLIYNKVYMRRTLVLVSSVSMISAWHIESFVFLWHTRYRPPELNAHSKELLCVSWISVCVYCHALLHQCRVLMVCLVSLDSLCQITCDQLVSFTLHIKHGSTDGIQSGHSQIFRKEHAWEQSPFSKKVCSLCVHICNTWNPEISNCLPNSQLINRFQIGNTIWHELSLKCCLLCSDSI